MVFSYWIVVLQLLKLGIPWEAIHEFEPKDINMILAVQAALIEHEYREGGSGSPSPNDILKNFGGM